MVYNGTGCAATGVSPRVTRSFQKLLVGTMSFPDSMTFRMLRRELWAGSA